MGYVRHACRAGRGRNERKIRPLQAVDPAGAAVRLEAGAYVQIRGTGVVGVDFQIDGGAAAGAGQGEDGVDHWHDMESGFGGREPLD